MQSIEVLAGEIASVCQAACMTCSEIIGGKAVTLVMVAFVDGNAVLGSYGRGREEIMDMLSASKEVIGNTISEIVGDEPTAVRH